ncbi:MAG: hypothetical protein GY754_41010 [bacterium]|nr:hypothetical protein [bacterium]
MKYLYLFTTIALVLSVFADRKKTLNALKISLRQFKNIVPSFLTMIVLISIGLFFVSDKLIIETLGNSNTGIGVLLASVLGSFSMMPGFIAFPLSGMLVTKGVAFMVVSAFTTTLMLVGILSYSVEKNYFGTRMTILRNILGFAIAIIVAIVTGICYGEIF